ncbi:hypothetical protein LOD99_13611 [Oopsacas minuta]|uniref:Uncharacterized protein n=1 Tax=Oopsacas minuta TaxID=111878 RepID=A0AAV7KHU5_9METZ|nr:hypothetical protein LOD99_13611 [Oopsacas minuta]
MASNNLEELDLILKKFKELHASLQQAEEQVLRTFTDISAENERLVFKTITSIKELENTKTYAENNIGDNELKSGILRDCDKKLTKLNKEISEIASSHSSVVWSELGYERLQYQLESIRAICNSNMKLPEITNPSYSGGIPGTHLVWPNHIAIEEQTGNIYVCDIQYCKIQIFDKKAKYLRHFEHIFHKPRAILIKNSKLYVIENLSNHIKFLVFSIENDQELFVSKGVPGVNKGEFGITSSFDIDSNDRWYITESDHCRIQILNPNFEHYRFFSASTTFSNPIQIRIRDNNVYVLDVPKAEIDPHYVKVCILKIDGTYLKTVVLSGVYFSMYFSITDSNYYIVSDIRDECLKIFDFEGNLLRIGMKLTRPKGIQVLKDGTVVSVSLSTPCINIF